MTIEKLRNDMVMALKSGDKFRKQVLSSMVEAVLNAAIDKKCKDNITEDLVNEVLKKQQKNLQEMVNDCPTDRTDKLEEYQKQLDIVKEYAPQLITDESEIEKWINYICACNGMIATGGSKKWIMKLVMPALKKLNVDMKIANKVLDDLLKKNDAIHGKA